MISKPYQWTIEATKAIQELQRESQRLPSLHLTFSRPFIHQIDAFKEIWAGILFIEKQGKK